MGQETINARILRNFAGRPEQQIELECLSLLQQLGFEVVDVSAANKTTDARTDLAITVARGAKRAKYRVEVKQGLRPSTLGSLIHKFKESQPPALLFTDYATPSVAALLREAGIGFVDTAGNAYVEFGSNLLFVMGQPRVQVARPEKVVRAFQPAGLRVIFTLLCAPEWVALTTREMAARLAVANGTVGRVLEDLRHLGFISALGRRQRSLHKRKELLDRWVGMYPMQLRPTLARRRLTAETKDWWQRETFDTAHIALGGAGAARVLTQYLKSDFVTLYTRGEPRPLNEIVVRHGLTNDARGEIEVLEAFWPAELPTDKPGLTPTILIYADLLATGDGRCIETAKMIYDDYLAQRLGED